MKGSVWTAIESEAQRLYEEAGGHDWQHEPQAVHEKYRQDAHAGRWVRTSWR